MRTLLKVGIVALSLTAAPIAVQAGTLEGAGIGAGVGAVVAGPPGAVVGGAVGAVVGGPNIITGKPRYARTHRVCWRDDRGYRRCAYR